MRVVQYRGELFRAQVTITILLSFRPNRIFMDRPCCALRWIGTGAEALRADLALRIGKAESRHSGDVLCQGSAAL
jgi:hypothetical protein